MSLVVQEAVNYNVDESWNPEGVGLELSRSGNDFMIFLLFIVYMFYSFLIDNIRVQRLLTKVPLLSISLRGAGSVFLS